MKKTFNVKTRKGFQITFENGVTLSTQFGWANYCENHDQPLPKIVAGQIIEPGWESNDAEVAIIAPDGTWLTREFKDEGDDVLGYVTLEGWLKAFDFARNYPKK